MSKIIKLKEYQLPPCLIKKSFLTFELFEEKVIVTNEMTITECYLKDTPLFLHGEDLKLLSISRDGVELTSEEFKLLDEGLELYDMPKKSNVTIVTEIYPQDNTLLEGLYKSGSIFCTQNEPEGFRRITYFVDRPDNMTIFTTKVIADKAKYPLLLSNGNKQNSGDLENNRHYVTWFDPFKKSSYLFALVAGDLGSVSDSFTTMSGREIELNIYVDKGNESKCSHAMTSLKNSMCWDEVVYGREYDLDIYNIVAVDSFNMGAMENKGLNIFNSHYVLADKDSATDTNFMGIESVIAHEYFHNWTGNRITCRDWFQLTLKEGLTVFRDQNFSADMNSATVQRISDVKALRERQFIEDASPTSHPIKPQEYMEINNFYTATVYEKGAEVIRMLHTLLGKEKYRNATDMYFEAFDGKAVRTEDFLYCMQEEGQIALTQFERWYIQNGTPELIVDEVYNEEEKTFTLTLTQKIPKSNKNLIQEEYMYPLEFALLDSNGAECTVKTKQSSQLLSDKIIRVKAMQQVLVFEEISEKPKLSINRNFSAPIIVHQPNADYEFLMQFDSDGFNRYEAAQQFGLQVLQRMLKGFDVDSHYIKAYGIMLNDSSIDTMYKAQLLELPSITALLQTQDKIDIEPLYKVRNQLITTLSKEYESVMLEIYKECHNAENSNIDRQSMANRALANRMLSFLSMSGNSIMIDLIEQQYNQSITMTDRICALDLLENCAPQKAETALQNFYNRYKDNTLVMNKYFSVLAASERSGTLDRVQALQNDDVYDVKVPNLVRSLIGVFARNYLHFHAKDGYGYEFVADKVIELDSINPMIAAGICGAFKSYPKMVTVNKDVMKKALDRIYNSENISKNVLEIVEKILDK